MNAHEQEHIRLVANVFNTYADNALKANQRRRRDYEALPSGHQAMLPDYPAMLARIDECIHANAEVLTLIAAEADSFMQPSPDGFVDGESDMVDVPEKKSPSEGDHERLRSVMRQVVREWTEAGRTEREASYSMLLDRLRLYSDEEHEAEDRSDLNVLIPGAGLGRLCYEIAKEGFTAQGCEFSMYMLLVSNTCLNRSSANQHVFYPFIHSLSNIVAQDDILTPLRFPDVMPSQLHEHSNGSMSMSAGDFTHIYNRPEHAGAFDVIITAFFLDTASNVIAYLDTIRHALADDGIWLNSGPLLWHHENTAGQGSIEMTLEDLIALCKRMGFVFDIDPDSGREVTMVESAYTANPRSMLLYHYRTAFWCARKAPSTP